MLRNMAVGRKLFLQVMVCIIALLVVGGIGYFSIKEIDQNAENMYAHQLLPTIEFNAYRANNRALETTLFHSMQDISSEKITPLREKMNELFTKNNKFLNELPAKLNDVEAKNLANSILANYPAYEASIRKAFALGEVNKNKEAYAVYEKEIIPASKLVVDIGATLQDLMLKLSNDSNDANTKNVKSSALILIITLTIAIVIACVLSLLISKMITNPLHLVQEAMRKAREGDFTATVDYFSNDELGSLAKSFNIQTDTLRDLIANIGDTSDQVAAFSEELSASAGETTRAAEHISDVIQGVASSSQGQVDSIGGTILTLNQLVDGVGNITKNTSFVSTKSHETSTKSAIGNDAIQTAVKQMNSINNAISGLNTVIIHLGERSNEIGEIVQVITGIAGQTNLLALNAAIEAARAGEQGKGFAVVADEVRKLAEQSGESAQKISALIGNIQSETDKAVESMQFATNEVKEGIGMVSIAGDTFVDIQEAISDVTHQIDAVSASINTMFKDTDSVVQSVNHIRQMAQEARGNTESASASTEEQLASMQEIAAATTSLSDMAEGLQNQIRKFKI